jgi:hypothetical protein
MEKSMKDFIEYLVKHLVDNPESVSINEIKGGTTVIYELHVDNSDIGKVIGRHGLTAQALRTLLSAISGKNGQHSFLEIMDKKPSEEASGSGHNPVMAIKTK